MDHEHETDDIRTAQPRQHMPWLEWLAAGIGLVLVLGVFGVIGWQAFNGSATPPAVTVQIEDVGSVDGGYRVLFRARNSTGKAATQVEIEGKLSMDGGEEVSRVVLDYIPGHSARKGGLFFTRDPRSGALAVRATGFAEP